MIQPGHNKNINPTGSKPCLVFIQGGCPGGLFKSLSEKERAIK